MAPTNLPDFDSPGTTVTKPSFLAHVVLRTNNYKAMVDFYIKFLGAHITFSNDMMSFVTYDHEHHRIAIMKLPDIGPKVFKSSGLEHIAWTYEELSDLFLAYRQRKANGMLPFQCVNHGPTTSFYYRDPDGNILETQTDNFPTAKDATDFMHGPYFAKNPAGVLIDPEDLIRRMKAGESDASLKEQDQNGEVAVPPPDGGM